MVDSELVIVAEMFNRLMVCMVLLCLAVPKSEQRHPEAAENTNKTKVLGYPVRYVVAKISRVAEQGCSLSLLAAGTASCLLPRTTSPGNRFSLEKERMSSGKSRHRRAELRWQPLGGLMSCKAGL